MTDSNFKTCRIEIRLTEQEKEKLKEYAKKRHITMSEAIRWLCAEIFEAQED